MSKGKLILSINVTFDELSILHFKFVKNSNKIIDITKQVEFKNPTIRNFSYQEHYEAPDDTEQNHQMQPQQHQSKQVDESNQMSQNLTRKPKTNAFRKSQRQIKALEIYGFDDIVLYALQVAEEVDLFEPTTYHEAITCSEADK